MPSCFPSLADAIQSERHYIIQSMFHTLAKSDVDFAGYQPSDDLIEDLSHFYFLPQTQSAALHWHRGLSPMAFSIHSAAEVEAQSANRDLWDKFGAHLSLTPAEARRLESGAPPLPPN